MRSPRIVAGSAVGLIMAAGTVSGASGASAHDAHQMQLLAPYLANRADGAMIANYLGGDGSMLREYVASRRAATLSR